MLEGGQQWAGKQKILPFKTDDNFFISNRGKKGFSKVLWTQESPKFTSPLSTTKTSEFLT